MNNTGVLMLSILIPTTPDRDYLFYPLYDELNRQIHDLHKVHEMLGKVEILVDSSRRFLEGGLSIGKKREALVNRANGKYLCFLDSDEWIAPNYVETLVRLCNRNKDVVTFRNLTKNDFYWTIVDMSLEFSNQEATPDGIVNRKPWHISPVRSVFAKMYEFTDTNYGEDWSWMEKVLKHCETEAKTNQILHTYNHSSKVSESDKIINAGYK